MSWQEKINSDFIIITGDGKEFRPIWKNAKKAVAYNITEFNFIGTEGTFVDRKTAKGNRYEIELYFQGDDNLDVAEEFEISARDPRPWTVSFPYYGVKTVQPGASLTFNNTQHNVTVITGVLLETLTSDNPQTVIDPIDKIEADNEELNVIFEETSTVDIDFDNDAEVTMIGNNNVIFNDGASKIESTTDAENYFNLFNAANSAVLNATIKPLEAIRATQAFISYPFQLEQSVSDRFDLLLSQSNKLRESVVNLVTPNDKNIYQNNAGILLSSLAVAASTPLTDDDYESSMFVLDLIDSLLGNYNQFLTDLDFLQTDNGGTPESFIPNFDALFALDSLMVFTASNLFNIALNERRERNIFLEKDSNVINLTHRFYGITEGEPEIDLFTRTNNIGLSEIIQIKKGRLIKYFV